MSKKPAAYIASTLSSSVIYEQHVAGGGDLPIAEGRIEIFGGANIPDKYMRTPDGAVITPVTSDELEILQGNTVFKLHEKNGFMKVSEKKPEPEVIAADMEGRDASAPLVDQDFKPDEDGHGAPVLNSAPQSKPGGNRRA